MFKGLMAMLTKSSAWEYENEYRLIAEEWPPAALNGDALVANDNLVQLPDGSLRAIILGCLASESTIQGVKALIRQSTYPITLKRAVKALNQYKLVITPS